MTSLHFHIEFVWQNSTTPLALSLVKSFIIWTAYRLVNLCSFNHISMSFSQELNTNIVLAKSLPFNFAIMRLWIFLNSSATRCRLYITIEASCLALHL